MGKNVLIMQMLMNIITNLLKKIHSSQIVHGSSSSHDTLENIINALTTRIATVENNMYKTGIAIPNNNCNDALSDGCYQWISTTANKPTDMYGTLFVTNSYGLTGDNNGTWVNQLAFGTTGPIYYRQKINTGAWTSWRQLH